MMQKITIPGHLEVRSGAGGERQLSGLFPYLEETEIAPDRFELFEPRSLEPADDVMLLYGHDFKMPLASVRTSSLELTNRASALGFRATIGADVAETSHGRDSLAMIRSGLAVGLSPAFVVKRDGARIARRVGAGFVRSIRKATLYELSVVSVPAYAGASVEARAWFDDVSDGRPARDATLWGRWR